MNIFKNLSNKDKIKVIVIVISLIVIAFLAISMFFTSTTTTPKSVGAVLPTQPKEIQDLPPPSKTVDAPSLESNQSGYSDRDIDYLFASLHQSNGSDIVTKKTVENIPIQPPAIPLGLPLQQSRVQSIPPVMQLPGSFQSAPPPTPPIPTIIKIDIYGIACSKGTCGASTNIGLLREKSVISPDESVLGVTMAGIQTNKRNIAY